MGEQPEERFGNDPGRGEQGRGWNGRGVEEGRKGGVVGVGCREGECWLDGAEGKIGERRWRQTGCRDE